MLIVEELQKMLASQTDLDVTMKEALSLRNDLIHQGLIQPKVYDLPLPGASVLPAGVSKSVPNPTADLVTMVTPGIPAIY